MKKMKLLDETMALHEIRALLASAGTAKLAVAFWGSGAIGRLGLGRDGPTAEILCNLESGACNPAEIRLLRDLPTIRLRSHPALHAKIYWTSSGAVVGSSNASANGLAVDGENAGSWLEANVLVDDRAMLADIEDRFDLLFGVGHDISDADLDRAERLWKARTKLAPAGKRHVGDLLAAFGTAPDHPVWKVVKLAYWKDELSGDDEEWLKAEHKSGRLDSRVSAYAGWNDLIAPHDWVIDMDFSDAEPVFSLWHVLPDRLDRPELRLVRETSAVRFAAFGRLTLKHADFVSLAGLADAVLAEHGDKEGRNVVIDLPTAMALLDAPRATAPPSEKAFRKAMEQIYVDAVAIGYHPNEYRRMLAGLGAVQTARQLIRGSATYGFNRLWELSRLDLSVEALVLKPEWQALFTPEELQIARRRLRKYDYSPENRGPGDAIRAGWRDS